MDNKYSFESLNYSGITDVPTLTIYSNKLTVSSYNETAPLYSGDNSIYPLQQISGNFKGSTNFSDSRGNLIYRSENGGYMIRVNGLDYELTYEDDSYYYMHPTFGKTYIYDNVGNKAKSLNENYLSKYSTDATFTLTHQNGTVIFEDESGTIGISGNTSSTERSIVKKSFKLKLDNKITIGNWGSHKHFAIKAYFSDWTNTRDITCQKLYEQTLIMNGVRPNGNSTSDTSALCHTDGFPVWVKIVDTTGNTFDWGLYVFQLRKKRSTFGMDKDNISQLATEGYILIDNMLEEIINPSVSIQHNYYNGLYEEFDRFSSVLKDNNYDDENKNKALQTINFENFLDVYLIHFLVYGWDSYAHNTIYATWDAQWDDTNSNVINIPKYYVIPYDMDMTFGEQDICGSGSTYQFNSPDNPSSYIQRCVLRGFRNAFLGESFATEGNTYSNWEYFRAKAVNRYAALRDEGIFSVENIINLAKKLYFQTTGLANAESLYNSYPEKLGMTGGTVTEEGKPADTLYDNPQFRDNYYRDKIRWGWYKMYNDRVQGNVLFCAGVCNYTKGRENILRIQQWITDRLNYLDTIFEYGSTPSHNTRNLKYNNQPVEIVNYNNKSIQSVIYNTIEVYGND